MRVWHSNQTISVFAGDLENNRLGFGPAGEKEEKQKGSTIFAGDRERDQKETAADIRARAQKQALKRLVDQMNSDCEISDGMDQTLLHREQAGREAKAAGANVKELRDEKQALMEQFGVAADSEEERGLQKYQGIKDWESKSIEELEEIAGPMAEYQKQALSLERGLEGWERSYRKALSAQTGDSRSVEATKLALLKVHPMVEERQTADCIMEEAGDEVIASAIKAAKESVEDTIEEIKEEEEKEEKKKEEQEALKEAGQQEPAAGGADYAQMKKTLENQQKLDAMVKKIMEEGGLLEEDIKGTAIDEIW